MKDLQKALLEKIEKEKLAPIPRWKFVLQNLLMWGGAGVFFLFGIFCAGIIWFFVDNLEILALVGDSPFLGLKLIFIGLPLVWVILSLVLVFFVGIFLGRTKKGYKLPVVWILLGGFLMQILLGFLVIQADFMRDVYRDLGRKVVFGESLDKRKERIWRMSENGFLGGKIVEILEEEGKVIWRLESPDRMEWKVILSEDVEMPEDIEFKVGDKLRLRGKLLPKELRTFEAERVMKFEGRMPREFRKRGERMDRFDDGKFGDRKMRDFREERKVRKEFLENLSE